METWKLVILTLLLAVVLGCVIGIVTGKHQVKKAAGRIKPLLTRKERLVYSLCIVLGTACILFGVFAAPTLLAPREEGMIYDEYGNPAEDFAEGNPSVGGAGRVIRGGGAVAVYSGRGETATVVMR